jgi:hypothetical protein
MNVFPIYLTFSDLVLGKGYLAEVRLAGRALVERETDAIWITGVNPGGLGDYGDDTSSAMSAFRQRVRLALSDLAVEAADFDAFRDAVRAFFNYTDRAALSEWEAARAQLRQEGVPPDAPGAESPERRDRKLSVDTRVVALMPENNGIVAPLAPHLAA